jgi:Mg2+ and Co2+ transporter CorA
MKGVFSACVWGINFPGAMPEAESDIAPLALILVFSGDLPVGIL